jgi:diaminopimelate dehydrogenase
MTKIRAAVVGYGNIGRFVVEALEEAPDFEIAGIVRRNTAGPQPAEIARYEIVDHIAALGRNADGGSVRDRGVDVAVVCSPSRQVECTAGAILARGICTVDSFDIHAEIAAMRGRLDTIARTNGATAIVAAGWDPGSDSVVRALLEACAPAGVTHTNFGPGMSMGHSVAARAICGVTQALSMTIPVGGGVHRREVYVETAPGVDFEGVAAAIRSDPYFAHDDTRVTLVPSVAALVDMTHGVGIVREGASGRTAGQRFEFSMRIHNPALTAQILVSAARAAVKMRARSQTGAFTMIELAPIDLLPGDREEIIRRLV